MTRTTITPVTNARGLVSMVLTVCDGCESGTKSFVLGIGLVPGGTDFNGAVSLEELNEVVQCCRGLKPGP